MALVTLSEYARMRGLNKSTVSRQLHKVIPNRGTDAKPLIDPEEADLARERHLNPLMARGASAAATGLAVPAAGAMAAPEGAAPSPPPGAASPTYTGVASVHKYWQSQQIKQRALKEAGLLTPTIDVTTEQMTAARRWRDRLLGAAIEWAPKLYGLSAQGAGEGQFRNLLDTLMRELISGFAEEAAAEAESDHADDGSDAGRPDDADRHRVGEGDGMEGLAERP